MKTRLSLSLLFLCATLAGCGDLVKFPVKVPDFNGSEAIQHAETDGVNVAAGTLVDCDTLNQTPFALIKVPAATTLRPETDPPEADKVITGSSDAYQFTTHAWFEPVKNGRGCQIQSYAGAFGSKEVYVSYAFRVPQIQGQTMNGAPPDDQIIVGLFQTVPWATAYLSASAPK